MPTPQRLPIVNSDDGTWGDILRQYLLKEHYDDGTDNAVNGGHKTITVRAGTATAGTAPLKFSSGTLTTAAEVGAMEFNNDHLYFTITTGTSRKKVALYDDTSGATGDLYYRNSSGYFTRLAIGADGKTLKAVSGTPTWSDSNTSAVASKSSNYTVVSGTDVVILASAASGNVAITLPTAASSGGYKFDIKRTDSSGNTCSVVPSGGDTIDGQGSGTPTLLPVQYMSITVVSDGSAWYIL
jgi:hypothetical protein